MSNDDVVDDLAPWLDGELPPERAAEVARAVGADPRLARRAEELRALDGLLGMHPVAAASPGFRARAAARAKEQDGPRLSLRGRSAWILRAACAAALVVVALLVWRPWTAGPSGPAAEPAAGWGDVGLVVTGPEADEGAADAGEAGELEAAIREIQNVAAVYLPLD